MVKERVFYLNKKIFFIWVSEREGWNKKDLQTTLGTSSSSNMATKYLSL